MQNRLSLMTFTLDIDVAMKKMTVMDCVRLTDEAGLGYVDLMNPSEQRCAEYAAALAQNRVKVYCYIGSVSFFSNDAQTIQKTMQRQLRDAATLGAKLYMIVPLNQRKDEKICSKLGKDGVRDRLREFFSIAVELADKSGIKVCFETTPQDYACLSGIEDCRWILNQVSGLGLVYDTANMLPHGDDPLAYYEMLKQYIVYVHLKDVALRKATWKDRIFRAEQTKDGQVMQCCVSGSGVIALAEILRRMEADGYRGVYALEYSHSEKYPCDYAQNAARLRAHLSFLNGRISSKEATA